MQSVYLQRIMKKNADMGPKKTNPKQTQNKPNFFKGQNRLPENLATPEQIHIGNSSGQYPPGFR
jgi:hypothetical protein